MSVILVNVLIEILELPMHEFAIIWGVVLFGVICWIWTWKPAGHS